MRILALVTDAFGGFGGIAEYNRALITALAEIDPSTRIVLLPRAAPQSVASIPANVVQKAPINNRLGYALGATYILIKEGPFDVIFCGHLFMVPLAAVLARLARVPLWLQLHGIECWKSAGKLIRWGSQHATLATVVSRYSRRRYLSWARVCPERVRVLPNTVAEMFTPGAKPEFLLQRYNLCGKQILLTVSRLDTGERYKGHDLVLKSMPSLLKRFPKLVYVVAGEGDDRPRLEALAKNQGLEGAVRFIGYIKSDVLPDVYRMADLFVMPSSKEGFGIVFLEAMACGVPAIGANSDGSVDALRDGLLGTAASVSELAAEISRALEQHPMKGHELAEEVRKIYGRPNFRRHVSRLFSEIKLGGG